MAARILKAEDNAQLVSRDTNDWLGYLFQRMDDGCRSIHGFANNPVTVVTYNYDRLIEFCVTRGLLARYRATDDEITRFWDAHPVVHLHGSVGPLLGVKPVPYGARVGNVSVDDAINEHLERAADDIKIVHQADGATDAFRGARNALTEAQRVVFLGFSFGRANVDRLGIENINPHAVVICTRYRMKQAEVAVNILEPFKRAARAEPLLCAEEDDCLLGLRQKIDNLAHRY